MTSGLEPEIIEAAIAGTVFRSCVFVGERYLAACLAAGVPVGPPGR